MTISQRTAQRGRKHITAGGGEQALIVNGRPLLNCDGCGAAVHELHSNTHGAPWCADCVRTDIDGQVAAQLRLLESVEAVALIALEQGMYVEDLVAALHRLAAGCTPDLYRLDELRDLQFAYSTARQRDGDRKRRQAREAAR